MNRMGKHLQLDVVKKGFSKFILYDAWIFHDRVSFSLLDLYHTRLEPSLDPIVNNSISVIKILNIFVYTGSLVMTFNDLCHFFNCTVRTVGRYNTGRF